MEWTGVGRRSQLNLELPGPVRRMTRDEFDVVFQPIVDLRSGEVFAVEALTCCKREEFRAPPVLFEAAVAENCCGWLGRTVRDVAFERCSNLPLFVNLHPAELAARWLVRPDDPIGFHDRPVYLEITESAAFDYFELCKSVLNEVCDRVGAHLVVDDFGAGHSNLKRVLDLHPKVVKFDRAIVTDLHKNRRQQTLLKNLVRLFEELDAKVVAEGIETRDELKACQDVGAHFGQGYFLARPAYPVPAVNWPA